MEKKHPLELITPERFDLMAKWIFAKGYLMNLKSLWFIECYCAHLRVMYGDMDLTDPIDADPNTKNSTDEYMFCFEELIDTLNEKEYNYERPIKITEKNQVIIDGSHRVIASLIANKSEVTTTVPRFGGTLKFGNTFNWIFFTNRHLFPLQKRNKLSSTIAKLPKDLEPDFVDEMALEYLKLKPDTKVFLLTKPSSEQASDFIYKKIEDYGKVIYRKVIKLSSLGYDNLIECILALQKKPKINQKTLTYSASSSKSVIIVLWCPNSSEDLEKIQKKIGSYPDSIYFLDSHRNAIEIGCYLCNENSVRFLCNADFSYYPVSLHRNVTKYSKFLDSISQSPFIRDSFCGVFEIVRSLYGIKQVNQEVSVEFIHYTNSSSKDSLLNSSNKVHEKHANLLGPIDDIVFNPNNHFYYRGMKFMHIEIVEDFLRKNLFAIKIEKKN